jgi:ABC-type bacteriocin/lantibiotic exporter with double-glycine peptidase domain
MELENIPEEEQGEAQMLPSPCGIRFCNVTYNYGAEGQLPTVSHANHHFAPGTCTAILGETGSGKTTLIRLLLALIKPLEGEIEIYGGGERQVLSPLHRCNFIYVPQGNTLLSGTLRQNMQLGRADATDEEMMEALQTACADFIEELPKGLDTVFAEQGGGLSEGQAQRIAIARALLRRGSILLLDEATSALDADTEHQLLENLLSKKDKTIIFVTHRHAVVDYCDQVIRTSRQE